MLELIFQGFMEWAYGLVLECWEYFSSALLDIMSLDFAYLETHVPIINDLMQVLLAAGWALLIGNLVFQAVKSMLSGLGFEGKIPNCFLPAHSYLRFSFWPVRRFVGLALILPPGSCPRWKSRMRSM